MSTEPITQHPEKVHGGSGNGAIDDELAKLRALVHRVELAGCHHRAARSRQLRAQQIDVQAMEHIATSGSLSPGHLADRLGITSGGVAALAHRLEEAGLVARRSHPTDRRMRVLVVTPKGLDHVREYLQPLLAPAELAVSWLSEPDRAVVARFLDLLAAMKERSASETPGPERDVSRDENTSALLM